MDSQKRTSSKNAGRLVNRTVSSANNPISIDSPRIEKMLVEVWSTIIAKHRTKRKLYAKAATRIPGNKARYALPKNCLKPLESDHENFLMFFSQFPRPDNAGVNRDAATRTEVGLVESDIMGGTTIRRLIGHKDFTASVQRIVIQQPALVKFVSR